MRHRGKFIFESSHGHPSRNETGQRSPPAHRSLKQIRMPATGSRRRPALRVRLRHGRDLARVNCPSGMPCVIGRLHANSIRRPERRPSSAVHTPKGGVRGRTARYEHGFDPPNRPGFRSAATPSRPWVCGPCRPGVKARTRTRTDGHLLPPLAVRDRPGVKPPHFAPSRRPVSPLACQPQAGATDARAPVGRACVSQAV